MGSDDTRKKERLRERERKQWRLSSSCCCSPSLSLSLCVCVCVRVCVCVCVCVCPSVPFESLLFDLILTPSVVLSPAVFLLFSLPLPLCSLLSLYFVWVSLPQALSGPSIRPLCLPLSSLSLKPSLALSFRPLSPRVPSSSFPSPPQPSHTPTPRLVPQPRKPEKKSASLFDDLVRLL